MRFKRAECKTVNDFEGKFICDRQIYSNLCIGSNSKTIGFEKPFGCEKIWEKYVRRNICEPDEKLERSFTNAIKGLRRFTCGRLDEEREKKNLIWIIENRRKENWEKPSQEFNSLAEHSAIGDWDYSRSKYMSQREILNWLKIFSGNNDIIKVTKEVIIRKRRQKKEK